MDALDNKTLLLEIKSAIAEAIKISTPYDADYAKAIKRIKSEIKWDTPPKSGKSSAMLEIYGKVAGKDISFTFHYPDPSWGAVWTFLGYSIGDAHSVDAKTWKPIENFEIAASKKLAATNKGLPTTSKLFTLKLAKEYPLPTELAKANLAELNKIIDTIVAGKTVKEATTSADVPGYATPKAFSKSGQKSNGAITNAKSIGYKKTKETHNTFKEIWEDSKSNNLNNRLTPGEYAASMTPLLKQLGTVSHNELATLFNFIKKADPKITTGKFKQIVKAVGHESTVGSKTLTGTDDKIKTEIERYFGI